MQRTLRAGSLPADSARLLSLPLLSSCTRSLPACPSMQVSLASAPACSLGRPARVHTCAGLPKGTRASAGAGLAARLQLRPTEPRGPCAQAGAVTQYGVWYMPHLTVSHSLDGGAWSGPGSALQPCTPAAMPASACRHAARLASAARSTLLHTSRWATCASSA